MEQFRGKYLVQNRVTHKIYETPQMAYILIAATLFGNYPKEERLKWVKDYYDAISTFDIYYQLLLWLVFVHHKDNSVVAY